jgi:tRNA(fMet)-specific endonuclease VapC
VSRYMLDTNTVSQLIKGHPAVGARVASAAMGSLCLSAITEGELLFGMAKRPEAKRLAFAVREFLRRVETLAWDSDVAERHGAVRSRLEQSGRILAPLDLLIAAHALAAGAVLVTNDRAFAKVSDLLIEDWSES